MKRPDIEFWKKQLKRNYQFISYTSGHKEQ